MSNFQKVSSFISHLALGKEVNSRKQYRKPQLKELGDLRTLTLGGSPGTNDSGLGGTRQPPSGDGFIQPGGFPPIQ
jgi:hypothetical protein